MDQTSHRALSESSLSPAQWAILFAASYYLPAPLERFILEAQLESEDNFSVDELNEAIDDCILDGLIFNVDEERLNQLESELGEDNMMLIEDGIVLTDKGLRVKEHVKHALLGIPEVAR